MGELVLIANDDSLTAILWEHESTDRIKKQEAIWCSFSFDSVLINENELNYGSRRLLEVDNRIIVPTGTLIRLIITSADVIHSFAIPSLGLKMDALPGRLNQTFMLINRPGVYYGQCSELCGVLHGFMPIVIEATNTEKYLYWLADSNN